jgi:ATP-binding cassette, subfamily C (CFTR/MRP), member 1
MSLGCLKQADPYLPGFAGVSLTNIISLAEYAKYLVLNWTELETSIGAVSRIKSFEATTLSEHLHGENDTPPQFWPRNGLVEFREVSAAYNADSDSNALSDLSLTINPGEKVGLCGRSGSGKSSLVLALFRMIELNHGFIHIDGIDISTLQRNEVRSRLNAIPQDPYFFAGTVRLNLDPWETQSDDAIRDALAKVELLHTIEDSCGGLDADMDVNLLSQGQHQLFCLARATLRPGKIVVLDEVTSSVDRKTDDLMQRIIRTEFADRTIIAIAHRLDTIVDFDKIAVLEKGVLIEYGSPAELLSKRSHFRNLYEMYKTKTADEDEMGQRKEDEEH